MANLELKRINKFYPDVRGEVHIIKDVNLSIRDGEFVVFVGPSGCGKSTILRMIAGLESISSGALLFDGQQVNHLSPAERKVGMVFQSYALYPHMSVRENIAFGVRYTQSWPKDKVKRAVMDIANALELTPLLDHKPSQLSGGQRQRVAIGRALIRQPRVFLLDEPLSNLDAALRVRMRLQIAEFHRRFRSTSIYVTHDQVEAMTLADKVVVLNAGRVEQVGAPLELYENPVSEFVAKFIGSPKINCFGVEFVGETQAGFQFQFGGARLSLQLEDINLKTGQKLTLGIRPEAIRISDDGPVSAQVVATELLGAESILYACLANDPKQELTIRCPGTLQARPGDKLGLTFPESGCHLFDESGRAL